MDAISFFNRYSGKMQVEKVYGGAAMSAVYGSGLGRKLVDQVVSQPVVSKIYGAAQSLSLSRHKIGGFVKDFQIPMEDFEPGPFASFNEFFIRKFRPGLRPFVLEPSVLPAFAEGRYLGFSAVEESSLFPVKGVHLNLTRILAREDSGLSLADKFVGGPALIARLCPVDYHRFHFPDDGEILQSYRSGHKLHAVNPLALAQFPDVFFTNERHVSLLNTVNFGMLAYVEVGALMVGKIVQTFDGTHASAGGSSGSRFKRGDEKGYFLFGGSTVIVFGQKGRWVPSKDILTHTAQGIETFVRLGDDVGLKS